MKMEVLMVSVIMAKTFQATTNYEKGVPLSHYSKVIESLKMECLRFVVCPLLALTFFSFFVAVAIYSTNKSNKAGGTCRLSSLYVLRCLWPTLIGQALPQFSNDIYLRSCL